MTALAYIHDVKSKIVDCHKALNINVRLNIKLVVHDGEGVGAMGAKVELIEDKHKNYNICIQLDVGRKLSHIQQPLLLQYLRTLTTSNQ